MIVENKTEKIAAEIAAGDQATVIDGGGRTLIPGLIDNHVHLLMNDSTQDEMRGSVDNWEKLHEVAAKQAEKMLRRGFTSVRDFGGPVFELKERMGSGKLVGPRIYPSGAIISQAFGHGDSRLPLEKSRRFFGDASSAPRRTGNCLE